MQVIELRVGRADRLLLDMLICLKTIDPSLSFRSADPQRRWPCRQGGADRTHTTGPRHPLGHDARLSLTRFKAEPVAPG
jgi:hypothetical protein